MRCWDCLKGLGRVQEAAAVCDSCGAAVCPEHAVAQTVRLTAVVGMGRRDEVATPARRIRCRICDAAERDREPTASGDPVRLRRK